MEFKLDLARDSRDSIFRICATSTAHSQYLPSNPNNPNLATNINMAPKSKKGANAQKSKAGEEEREEPLQAVVFADSFETRFAPFSLELPRVTMQNSRI